MEPRNILEVIEEGSRLEPSMGARASHVQQFEEKLDALIGLISNRGGFSRSRREYVLREAMSTQDFPILFGNILERQLLARYRMATPDWRGYLAAGTQRDFRVGGQEAIGIYGLEKKLAVVEPKGEYQQDDVLGEGKVSITLRKRGRKFGLDFETIINDNLGAFSDIPERLANAALATEYFEATGLFAMATGPHTSLFGAPITHPIDGASITNKGVLPLTVDNLGATITLMRKQKDKNNNPIVIEGFELVVPPDLEIAALQILNSVTVMVAGTSDVVRPTTNVMAQMSIRLHVNPYLPLVDTSATNDTTWYLFARLSSGQAARLNFLQGHEAPEIVMKAPNKVALGGGAVNPLEGDWETDSMWWRVRHIMGGTQIDPRLCFAQVAP